MAFNCQMPTCGVATYLQDVSMVQSSLALTFQIQTFRRSMLFVPILSTQNSAMRMFPTQSSMKLISPTQTSQVRKGCRLISSKQSAILWRKCPMEASHDRARELLNPHVSRRQKADPWHRVGGVPNHRKGVDDVVFPHALITNDVPCECHVR